MRRFRHDLRLASNAVIGYVADKLVDLGGTVIFGETTEFLGGEHILANRAVAVLTDLSVRRSMKS